jgi:histidyl-tRNA synthetase
LKAKQDYQRGIEELQQIAAILTQAGYGTRPRQDRSPPSSAASNITPARSIEAELLFDVTNEKGQIVQFGSVGGGGRYDGLVSRFMGQPVPATGFPSASRG